MFYHSALYNKIKKTENMKTEEIKDFNYKAILNKLRNAKRLGLSVEDIVDITNFVKNQQTEIKELKTWKEKTIIESFKIAERLKVVDNLSMHNFMNFYTELGNGLNINSKVSDVINQLLNNKQ